MIVKEIKINTKVRGLDGNPMMTGDNPPQELTYKSLLSFYLHKYTPQEQQGMIDMTDEKSRMFGILTKIHGKGDSDFEPEDITLINKRLALFADAEVCGLVKQFFQPEKEEYLGALPPTKAKEKAEEKPV